MTLVARKWILLVVVVSAPAVATIFGSVRGLIHDPQHRPLPGATVVIHAANSDWSQTATSNENGEFTFAAVPLGTYTVTVNGPGFATSEQTVGVASSSVVNLHFQLALAGVNQTVQVTAEPALVNPESTTSETYVSRSQITQTPGADRTNSMSMVTDYVPGAVIVHDQLHIRGGHQAEWMLDGVPVPNTNISTNVGPQFDPKDIASLEVQRGGLSAEYGDRAYGVFNVVTRSGFERNNQGELIASYGSFNETNDQINFGSHSERFAYYASLSGNRTDVALETPQTAILHDLGSGESLFGSIIFNRTPQDQLRLVASVRNDHYQVPNTTEQQTAGIRDVENEADSFVNFSWVHTSPTGTVVTLSPFYHFNRAHYLGGQADTPVIPNDNRGSHYAGGVAMINLVKGRHNFRAGLQGFAQRDTHFLSLEDVVTASLIRDRQQLWGDLEALFVEEQFKATSWLTFNGGGRLTHFAGGLSETAGDPRIGAAVRIPRLGWVLHGFYGRYYQAPPLLTVSGPLLNAAAQQGFVFLPLRGEKDEQHEFGLAVPFRGWAFEVTDFRTAARNYFDHDVLGNSNIFFPLTLDRALVHGWEATVRSPQVLKRGQVHLAYSHQYAQAAGGVTGGLTNFSPSSPGYYFLDHDQRDTLSTGAQFALPWRSWVAASLDYGSGFLNGDGPFHLPPHTTGDLSLGKSVGEAWSVRLTALNITNHRYLIDNSNTFGGTHYFDPRTFSVQVKYAFRY